MIKKFLIGTIALALMLSVVSSVDAFSGATLRKGSKGADVIELQGYINAVKDGSFGPMTEAAVKAWQASKGLVADGIVGPKTQAAMVAGGAVSGNFPAGCTSAAGYSSTTGVKCDSTVSSTLPAGCTSTAGYSATTGAKCDGGTTVVTGPLVGSAGTIATLTKLSQYSAEEIGAGQSDVKVLGFDIKASKEGDIGINSTKVSFVITNASGSTKIADYFKTVSVWQGSTKIGSASTADFNKDSTGNYSKIITLSGATVRSDVTEKFYVTVDALSNLDSGDIDSEVMTIGIDNVRYVDGSGVVTTEALQGDLPISAVSIAVVSFATAADTELKISLSSSSPAADVVRVKTAADTSDVVLLKGKMKVEGTSNIWLDEVPFLFTTNATNNLDALAATVKLTIDGKEYSESMPATAGSTEAVNFNNLDLDITAGSTVDFTVSADISDIETPTFDEGDYMKAELTSTNRDAIVAENSENDQLATGEMTGTAMGNTQYFYSIAPKVEVVSASIVPNDNGSNPAVAATAKMKLKVTAQGGTVYLNGDDETTGAKEFIILAADGGNASSSIGSYTFTTSGTYVVSNSGLDNEYYTVYDGDSMYIEIEALVNQGASSPAVLVGMKGTSINFGTVETDDTSRSANVMSWSTLTDILKTGKTSLDS